MAWRSFLFKCVVALRISSRLIFREKLEPLQLDVLTQSSRRTQRLGTGEPVNIPADLVSKAKATSIANTEQWTSTFTAYMSVIISKHLSRAAELLEYLSLIRYAAKYHRGLGWRVYDVTFRQKAAANKCIKGSIIDSQL